MGTGRTGFGADTVMIYQLRDGKFSSIRGAQSSPVKLVDKK